MAPLDEYGLDRFREALALVLKRHPPATPVLGHVAVRGGHRATRPRRLLGQPALGLLDLVAVVALQAQGLIAPVRLLRLAVGVVGDLPGVRVAGLGLQSLKLGADRVRLADDLGPAREQRLGHVVVEADEATVVLDVRGDHHRHLALARVPATGAHVVPLSAPAVLLLRHRVAASRAPQRPDSSIGFLPPIRGERRALAAANVPHRSMVRVPTRCARRGADPLPCGARTSRPRGTRPW